MIFYAGYLGMSLMTLACHLRIYCRFLDRLILLLNSIELIYQHLMDQLTQQHHQLGYFNYNFYTSHNYYHYYYYPHNQNIDSRYE